MQELILRLDYWLFSLINQQWTTPLADTFFFWLTDLHKLTYFKYIAVPLVLAVFVRTYKRQGVSAFLFLLLAVGFSDWTGARVKDFVERPRPKNNPEIQVNLRTDAGSYSFYSNHAANMMTFAVYTSEFFPATRLVLVTVAVMVGYSRVYNGVHYPSDVLGGLFIGLIWGILFSKLFKRINLALARRKTQSS